MARKLLSVLLIFLGLFSAAQAVENHPYDITLTYPLISKDPDNFHGYRIAAGYQPQSLIWNNVRLYFDFSYGHWYASGANANKSISIYAIAPILRIYLTTLDSISAFVEASIGPSYLSRTRIATRNLGMHFSFQDQLGLGFAFGPEQRLAVSFSGLHYSNGSLCEHNSGITIPLIVNVNYRF